MSWKTWKIRPQKLLIISPIFFFSNAQPAQIQPKSQFLFHKNLPPRDLSIMTLPADCWAFHPRFSKEQTFSEHCSFEPSQTVKLVTGEENIISIFQDETVFGKVMWSDPVAPVAQVLVIVTVDSHEPDPPPEPCQKTKDLILNYIHTC